MRVAQLDRASGYGPEGREFESSRARTRDPCLTLSRTRGFLLFRSGCFNSDDRDSIDIIWATVLRLHSKFNQDCVRCQSEGFRIICGKKDLTGEKGNR